jgi:colanic acid biosynthesis glycosyl transferase WcaI
MKILVVTQYFWPEQFKIIDLCHELVARGHEITVYTGLPNYPEGEFLDGYSYLGPYKEKLDKIKVIRAPLIPRGKNKSFQLALNFISFCISASLLAPFLVRGKFDKIFVYEPSPITVAIPAIVLKFFKRTPIILWVLDLWPESLEATGVVKNKVALSLVRILVKWIYRNCDKIFITSKGFAPKILSMGIPQEKIMYWPQWAEAFFSNLENDDHYHDENIPVEGFKIMFAGNIGSSQDFETIVEAASILKDKKNIKFLILGDGIMKKWAEEEVAKRKLGETFFFLGKKPVEMMPYYFSKADVMMVSLTNTELFSITVPAKVQAYLASGKPILGSLNGEGAAIIDQWKAGLTCNATNPEMLAKKIVEMSALSKDELKVMGENARKCYLSEFEREKLISILEEELRMLK